MEDGTYVSNHDHNASIIWNSYKERLGRTDLQNMTYDLNTLIQRHKLDHLDDPFTPEEIATVIKDMPIDKAPGPDGFNGFFLKKAGIL
jgi:hypothetical protein